jgi:hypothetical protein
VLAPFLFILGLDFAMKRAMDPRCGIPLGPFVRLTDLDFEDDLALLSAGCVDLQSQVNRLVTESKKLGLRVNSNKTKTMRIAHDDPTKIIAEGNQLEDVEKFTYLGVTITTDGRMDSELSRRIGLAANAFNQLKSVWKSGSYRLQTKLRLLDSCVISVLTYGCESWHLTKAQNSRVLAFENSCLRRILHISWRDHVTNVAVRDATKF